MTQLRLCCALALTATLWATAQDNRYEPNQTRRTAVRMEAGDYKGLFCDNEDWYAIEVPAGTIERLGLRRGMVIDLDHERLHDLAR